MIATTEEIDAARRIYARDAEIEIDDNAEVSRGDESAGAWVQAWVWVPFPL